MSVSLFDRPKQANGHGSEEVVRFLQLQLARIQIANRLAVRIRGSCCPYACPDRSAGIVGCASNPRSRWCSGSLLVASFRPLCLGRHVHLHCNRSFQQNEARPGANDSGLFPTASAARLRYGGFGTDGSSRTVAPAISRACRDLPDRTPGQYVCRQYECGSEWSYPARQDTNSACLAGSDAGFLHRPSLVVNACLNSRTWSEVRLSPYAAWLSDTHRHDLVVLHTRYGEAQVRAFKPERNCPLGAKQVHGFDLHSAGQRHRYALCAER